MNGHLHFVQFVGQAVGCYGQKAGIRKKQFRRGLWPRVSVKGGLYIRRQAFTDGGQGRNKSSALKISAFSLTLPRVP
jgi:hypothetical protein